MAEAIAPTAEAAVPNGDRRKQLFKRLAIGVAIAAALWALWHFIFDAGRVSTDNAYVGADSAQVTAQVAGTVTDVRAAGTQMVHKGDILVVLDDADARLEVASAQAALRQAQQRFAQQAANAGAAQARIGASIASINQAQAQLRSANANVEKARTDLARRQSIASTGAVAGEELTAARASLETAVAARDLAAAAVAAAQANRASTSGDAAASTALVSGSTAETAPDVIAARARVDMAMLNLARTVVRAPIDGVVTNRQVQVGQRIAAGAPIMIVVPVAAAFVDANFKESQFSKIRIGQPVELTSDFYGSDVVYHGRVAGIAGGTGAAFSLIPAQNATGNWVKVVQRLPVRIALDPKELHDHPLRVGLTMEATIDTRAR